MTNYKSTILNTLIDKYEKSKSFIGDNRVNQSFSISLTKLFPKYSDVAEYDVICQVNNSIDELEKLGLIKTKKQNNGVVQKAILNTALLDEIYKMLKRIPKTDTNRQLSVLLEKYSTGSILLHDFCTSQLKRINENKKPEFYDGNILEYEQVLKAADAALNVQEETYIRDFSIQVFGDTKVFETIKSKVVNLLYNYGDYPEKETLLEELNIIKNPGHVYIKGCCKLYVSGQVIDLSSFNGDIGLSSMMLKQIERISLTGKQVVTVENLTAFHRFSEQDTTAVYLGGYHNSQKREFLKKIYAQNPNVKYLHYGDIDAGGFYILLHLRNKTGINFLPYRMDKEILMRYAKYIKCLTDNDRLRLKNLLESEFSDTIQYMLENNCKLEQEALD